MISYVRPQIYSTMPVSEVEAQLRREKMPAPFTRRMRVINLLSAATLRKIEDDMLAPFDVMDLHHVLDAQVSQDAIIGALESKSLAEALKGISLYPLWIESRNKPLLNKGFTQGWIQRFFYTPFDPICVMLALRAKMMLDVIDELGHSYNLLRSLGFGWIDFGDVPGETPGDPDSYIPPGVDGPIDYPDPSPEPKPEPGVEPIPGPEPVPVPWPEPVPVPWPEPEPEPTPPPIPPPAPPGPPAPPIPPIPLPAPPTPPVGPPTVGVIIKYPISPGAPGAPAPGVPAPAPAPGIPAPAPGVPAPAPAPAPGTGGAGGNVTAPSTLDLGPSALMSPGGSHPFGSINCCADFENPAQNVSIGYFTDEIDAGETLGLTVEGAHPDCGGNNYAWAITEGPGSLSEERGLDVIYTAPADGHDCPGDTTITLSCGGRVMDTLVVKINYDYAIAFNYGDPELEIGRNGSLGVSVVANGTPLTWSVSGDGFSLDHAETEGVGNTLRADETACGSAEITVVDCDGNIAAGEVRCTEGQWANVTNGCIIEGPAEYKGSNTYEKVQGKYKQLQQLEFWYGLGSVGEESCLNVDCRAIGGAACVDCLEWNCPEMNSLSVHCGNWCCGDDGCGPYPENWDGGWCIRNIQLKYWEWIC